MSIFGLSIEGIAPADNAQYHYRIQLNGKGYPEWDSDFPNAGLLQKIIRGINPEISCAVCGCENSLSVLDYALIRYEPYTLYCTNCFSWFEGVDTESANTKLKESHITEFLEDPELHAEPAIEDPRLDEVHEKMVSVAETSTQNGGLGLPSQNRVIVNPNSEQTIIYDFSGDKITVYSMYRYFCYVGELVNTEDMEIVSIPRYCLVCNSETTVSNSGLQEQVFVYYPVKETFVTQYTPDRIMCLNCLQTLVDGLEEKLFNATSTEEVLSKMI